MNLEKLIDDAASFQHFELRPLGRGDAGQLEHGGGDHVRADRLRRRMFAARIALADDAPGFTVDLPVEQLGTKIILPPFLEDRRQEIEARLTPLPDPRADRAAT